MGFATVTPDSLNESARKFRTQLLMMILIGLESTIKHMTLRTGIRYEEVVGELSGNVELEPYKGTIPAEDDFTIAGRTLATFLGQTIKLADPNALISTLYGSHITSGKAIESAAINKYIIAFIMRKLSQSLNKSVFSAVRNAVGTTTADLFNGLDTIVASEIVATNISVANGNYFEIIGAIDDTNAVDKLKSIYQAASDELKDIRTKLFMPYSAYNAYNEDYKTTTGAIPYNTEFKKTFLEGTDNKCELVPLIGKSGSSNIQLTTKENTLIGVDQMSDYEKIEVRRGDNPFKLQFITTMFFGTQFESLSKEVFLNAKIV